MYPRNWVRPATAPDTMVAAVAAKAAWKKKSTPTFSG